MEAEPEIGMSFARDDGGRGPTETEVRSLMKVLIGVDPPKVSVAVAAIAQATGELLERASFSQDRAGSRALERWAKRFSERRWAVENAVKTKFGEYGFTPVLCQRCYGRQHAGRQVF